MTIDVSREWMAFHVFYSRLDSLIIHAVAQVMRKLQMSELIADYFYIRYWNGGPHLRLRVATLGESDAVGSTIVGKLGRFLTRWPSPAIPEETYDEVSKSMRKANDGAKTLSRTYADCEVLEVLQPVNSIQARSYTYDSRRYGGGRGRAVSEGHFCFSSDLTTTILEQVDGGKLKKLRTALHCATESYLAMEVSAARGQALLLRVAGQLAGVVARDAEPDPVAYFGLLPYEAQRGELEDVRSHLAGDSSSWSCSGRPGRIADAWRVDLDNRWRQLERLQSHEKPVGGKRETITMDYLHLLANRLGVTLLEESYLYYLLARCLEDMTP